MKKAHIVIGSGYGDEGKGLTTEWLCRNAENPVVVRFNGGAQAAHTVQLPDGRRNVFHHIGSASLQSVPTILSKYMSISPVLFMNECYELYKNFGIKIPKIYVDPRCEIITLFEV